MAGMTPQALKDLITETTLPLIQAHAGKDISDVVKQVVKDTMAAEAARLNASSVSNKLFDGDGTDAPRVERNGLDKGIIGARFLRTFAAAKGNRDHMAAYAKSQATREPEHAASWLRVEAAIKNHEAKAMSAGDPLAGGFTVPIEFSSDIIELLRASGVVRSLNPTTLPMHTGTLKIPRITGGVTAAYVGENTNATKSEMTTGQLTMNFRKLAALVPISNDLLRYGGARADEMVRDDAVRSIGAREDLAFIRGDGTSAVPRGIKNWIDGANKFTANGTVSLANVTIDLGRCMQALMDANINLIIQQGGTGAIDVRPGWIFAPKQWRYLTTVQTGTGQYAFRDEMMRGTLWGFPYRVTTQCENTTVYFGAFAHAVIGEAMSIMVDASQEAAYHDGTNVVAAFSQDQTVIRVLCEHDFALRHDKAFAMLDTVLWGS